MLRNVFRNRNSICSSFHHRPFIYAKSSRQRQLFASESIRYFVVGRKNLNALPLAPSNEFFKCNRVQHAPPNKRQHTNANGNEKHKLPRLLYIQHPWKYLKTKFQLLRLKLSWDKAFREKEFIHGTKQAVVLMTDLIRNQEALEISSITTPMGFQQITRDMVLSKEDPRLKLVRFRRNDIKKAIPVRVKFLARQDFQTDRKHCIIDMFFVGMRNVNDFESALDNSQMREFLRKYETTMHESREPRSRVEEELLRRAENSASKVVFAEIFTRFYREYTADVPANWFVSFYKIVSFEVLAFE